MTQPYAVLQFGGVHSLSLWQESSESLWSRVHGVEYMHFRKLPTILTSISSNGVNVSPANFGQADICLHLIDLIENKQSYNVEQVHSQDLDAVFSGNTACQRSATVLTTVTRTVLKTGPV